MAKSRSAEDPAVVQARESRRLSTLLEISHALSGTLNLRSALHRALEILAKHHGTVRSLIVFLHDHRELHVEAADGLDAPLHSVRYRVGEGIIGKVVESSRPIVVPRVSKEPEFLNRAAKRADVHKDELSFICVPILLNRRAVGAIGVDLKFNADRDYERYVKFLGIVASSIAAAVKIQRLVEEDKKRLVDENTHLRQELKERYDFSSIIGTSGPVRQMYEQMSQVAATNTTVLIRGESGTGKELVAHSIHYNSPRANKPFVKVSCAALPDSLIESELFGYERGAFTGAEQRKKGRFEMAEGGTLFLDEIGDINLSTQVKLLRVLQEREFERLGSTETVKVNVRLVAASNRPLASLIEAGAFRLDLYYRLKIVEILLPPLRERRTDIPLLANHFVARHRARLAKPVQGLTTRALAALMRHAWPGNVRELENTIQSMIVLTEGEMLDVDVLPPALSGAAMTPLRAIECLEPQSLEDIEAYFIAKTLRETQGSRSAAADVLGIDKSTLWRKIKRYGLE
jgi:Nif-specific regulatory protein